MAEINLEPGQKQKVVSQPGSDEAYNIKVSGASVFLNHRSNGITREGKKLVPGDRTKASNLRGKPLFAKNPSTNSDNATIHVDQAGFSLDFQARSILPSVITQLGETSVATDSFDDAGASGVDVSNGGSTSVSLIPPGRSKQVSVRVEGTAGFDVTVDWGNTSETYSSASGVVEEVVPVYSMDGLDVTITDTSGGSNSVDYDMAVI